MDNAEINGGCVTKEMNNALGCNSTYMYQCSYIAREERYAGQL